MSLLTKISNSQFVRINQFGLEVIRVDFGFMFNKQDEQTSIVVAPISDVMLQYVIVVNLYIIVFL